MEYVVTKGYCDEDENWYWRYGVTPKPDVNETFNLSNTHDGPPQLTDALPSQPSKPKKDFTNTRYTEDFVKKYALNEKSLKTNADQEFASEWKRMLAINANQMQQIVYGYDTSDTELQLMLLGDRGKSKLNFISYDCEKEIIEKAKQVEYRLNEFRRTKRL
jgi:hypothetical protein